MLIRKKLGKENHHQTHNKGDQIVKSNSVVTYIHTKEPGEELKKIQRGLLHAIQELRLLGVEIITGCNGDLQYGRTASRELLITK